MLNGISYCSRASGCKWLLKWLQVVASGCKWLLGASGSEWLQVAAQVAASGSPKKHPACSMKAFTHKSFYTQTLLHRDAFTHRRFCTQKLLHTEAFTHKRVFLHADTVTRRRFYTQKLLHTGAFTHRSFYTQTLLHTDAFTHNPFLTHRLLHPNFFARPGCRGHQKIAILHQFLTLDLHMRRCIRLLGLRACWPCCCSDVRRTQEQARGAWSKLEFGSSSTSFGRKRHGGVPAPLPHLSATSEYLL